MSDLRVTRDDAVGLRLQVQRPSTERVAEVRRTEPWSPLADSRLARPERRRQQRRQCQEAILLDTRLRHDRRRLDLLA